MHEGARRFVARRAGVGGAACRALAERREAPDPGGGAEEDRRQGLGGPPAARGDAGRAAGRPRRSPALATLLERHGDDPITVDAALSGLRGSEHVVLQRLLAAAEQTPQRTGAAVTMLAATMVRGGEDARLQELFQTGGRRRDAPRGSAMRCSKARRRRCSAAPLPGSGRRGAGGGRGAAAAAAASNAPGGRAGPGGAPAFPGTRPGDAAGGRRARPRQHWRRCRWRASRRGSPRSRRPAAKPASAPQALLARLTWPGKPAAAGAAPAAAPLTRRNSSASTQGKAVYTTLCVACHQENGQGLEKLGAVARRLDLRPRRASRADADPDQRQGRTGRLDAAARHDAERRSDRRRS